MAHWVWECSTLYFKPTFQSEYWVESKAMHRVKAPMMTTRAIIFHTHCLEWMDGCGGRAREREVQRERKGRAEVSEFNEICGFLWWYNNIPHITYITNQTNDDIMLHLIYSGVQQSECRVVLLFYFLHLMQMLSLYYQHITEMKF